MCNLHVGHSWRISSVGKNPGPNQEPKDSGRILNRGETHGWLVVCFIKYPDSAAGLLFAIWLTCKLAFYPGFNNLFGFFHMYSDSFYPGFNNLFILPYVKKAYFAWCFLVILRSCLQYSCPSQKTSQKLRASQAVGLYVFILSFTWICFWCDFSEGLWLLCDEKITIHFCNYPWIPWCRWCRSLSFPPNSGAQQVVNSHG